MLAHIGRLAQFSASAKPQLLFQESGIPGALRIAQPRPDEVEDLVDYDVRQAGLAQEFGFEGNGAATDKAGGMNGGATIRIAGQEFAAMGGELWLGRNENRAAGECRQPDES